MKTNNKHKPSMLDRTMSEDLDRQNNPPVSALGIETLVTFTSRTDSPTTAVAEAEFNNTPLPVAFAIFCISLSEYMTTASPVMCKTPPSVNDKLAILDLSKITFTPPPTLKKL
jgi:ABC-type sulfate transport system permease component